MKDTKRLKWIRSLPCCIPDHQCEGEIEVHHQAGAGMALKHDDSKIMPLCHKGHIEERHRLRGYFKGWTKARIKAWEAEMVAKYQALYEQEGF